MLQDWGFLICPIPAPQTLKFMTFLGRCFRKMKRITPQRKNTRHLWTYRWIPLPLTKSLPEVMNADAKADASKGSTGQRFRYVETPLIEAIRNGYVIEIQEPTVISNPGVLVGLNALLDRCASITLTTGEVIHRHPDTVVIITTNNNYAGCRDMNQSVISRMNLVFDMDAPDVATLTERAMGVTGCTDRSAVSLMASTVMDVNEHCKESMITDGSCGVRELISWVQSYMVSGSALESAKYTILSSASADPECREEILNTCIEQKFAA